MAKMYLKSVSGQIYAVNHLPKYTAGYELVNREAFIDWCNKCGMTPEEMGDNMDNE